MSRERLSMHDLWEKSGKPDGAKTRLKIGGVRIVLEGIPRSMKEEELYKLAASQTKPTILSGLSRLPTAEEMILWQTFEQAMNDLEERATSQMEAMETDLKTIGRQIAEAKRKLAVASDTERPACETELGARHEQRNEKRKALMEMTNALEEERGILLSDVNQRLGSLLGT